MMRYRASRRSSSSTVSRSSSESTRLGRSVRDLIRSSVEATSMNCDVSPRGSSGNFSTYARYASVTSASETSEIESLRSSIRSSKASSGPSKFSVATLKRFDMSLFGRTDRNTELLQLLLGQRLGGFHHGRLSTARHGKCLYLA